jgi:CDP-diacylglycerol--serine O-phosphatidyltransferase
VSKNKPFSPSALTSANMFFGFLSIIKAISGEPLIAGWLIIIAAILDALDGKVARLMDKGSHFGLELDSISDIVSFGVAPAILMYEVYLQKLEFFGLVAAFIYLLCGGFRLAWYNVIANPKVKKEYIGLPIPTAAISIASFIEFNFHFWNEIKLDFLFIPLIAILSFLMVSRVQYDTLPKLNFKESAHNKAKLIFLLVSLALVALWPATCFFPILIIFITQGVIRSVIRSFKRVALSRIERTF